MKLPGIFDKLLVSVQMKYPHRPCTPESPSSFLLGNVDNDKIKIIVQMVVWQNGDPPSNLIKVTNKKITHCDTVHQLCADYHAPQWYYSCQMRIIFYPYSLILFISYICISPPLLGGSYLVCFQHIGRSNIIYPFYTNIQYTPFRISGQGTIRHCGKESVHPGLYRYG